MMKKKALTQKIVIPLMVALSLLCSLPAYATDDLNQKLDGLAKKLASTAQGVVVKGTETQVYISLGQLQGILPGNKFEIVRPGEPLKVGDAIIGYEETWVAEVEVERSRDKVSICKVLEKSSTPQNGDKAYQLRNKINTLVVGQFFYNQGFNRLTKSLQEKMVTSITNHGMLVVERDQLERVLKEQKLGYSGLVNVDTAKKIGELLGAEGMLIGTLSDMGNSITINARMVDIESGKTVSAGEVKLAKTPLIAQLIEIPIEVDDAYGNNSSSVESSSGTTQRFDNFFQNDFLRVEPKSVHKSKDQKSISVSFLLKNMSKEKKYLSIYRKINTTKIALDTHQGEILYAKTVAGMSVNKSPTSLNNYSSLSGESQTVLMCSFESEQPITSNVFSISAEMFLHSGEGRDYSKYTIGLPNIKIK